MENRRSTSTHTPEPAAEAGNPDVTEAAYDRLAELAKRMEKAEPGFTQALVGQLETQVSASAEAADTTETDKPDALPSTGACYVMNRGAWLRCMDAAQKRIAAHIEPFTKADDSEVDQLTGGGCPEDVAEVRFWLTILDAAEMGAQSA
jgi:hypothetical protein